MYIYTSIDVYISIYMDISIDMYLYVYICVASIAMSSRLPP